MPQTYAQDELLAHPLLHATLVAHGKSGIQQLPIAKEWLDRVEWRSFSYYPRLRRVYEHVQRSLNEATSLRTAAQVACCEYKYFSAYFHKKVKVPFGVWLRMVRVAQAAVLLASEDMAVTEVSRLVGFQSLRTLERCFKGYCGITPLQYRHRLRP